MRSNNLFLKLVLLMALIGIGVSGKLLSIHNRFSTGQASLTETCSLGGSMGCASIAVSQYSDIAGVPLAAIAMGYYFTILFLGIWAWRNYQAANEPLYVSFFLSTLAAIVTVVMFTISNYVLKQFCQWCAVLWMVNLAIWPLLVKQLGLGWGNALASNAELLGGGKVNLRRERVLGSLGFGALCVAVFAIIGLASKGLNAAPKADGSLIKDYESAPIVMLPAEAYGGSRSKGFQSQSGAPVMELAELADFQCPACRMAAQFLKPFLLKHGDKVRLTFHNFPLDGACNPFAPNGMHNMACPFAKAGLCAAKQNKFWDFHDQVYDRQEEGLTNGMIDEIVEKIGLDKPALDACLNDPQLKSELERDMQLGELVNLEATPTLIINGRKLRGVHSPAEMEELLDYLEKQAKR